MPPLPSASSSSPPPSGGGMGICWPTAPRDGSAPHWQGRGRVCSPPPRWPVPWPPSRPRSTPTSGGRPRPAAAYSAPATPPRSSPRPWGLGPPHLMPGSPRASPGRPRACPRSTRSLSPDRSGPSSRPCCTGGTPAAGPRPAGRAPPPPAAPGAPPRRATPPMPPRPLDPLPRCGCTPSRPRERCGRSMCSTGPPAGPRPGSKRAMLEPSPPTPPRP